MGEARPHQLRVGVSTEPGSRRLDDADALARRLGTVLVPPPDPGLAFLLVFRDDRLELRSAPGRGVGPVYADFVGGTLGYRRRHGGRNNELLIRAVRGRGKNVEYVIDATAGLGRDAFVLACAGLRVRMLERSAVAAALVREALQQAHHHPETRVVAERLELHEADAIEHLDALTESKRPDIVYLDPMYPIRRNAALAKKEMRVFRDLVGDDSDAPALLASALQRARHRVVVKRPRLAPALEGARPTSTLTGKRTRFDIYVLGG